MTKDPRFWNRRQLLTAASLGGLGLAAAWAGLRDGRTTMKTTSDRMPILFFGHGSPMNAITDNAFTQRLAQIGRDLPRPRAILCVSAHWMTEGTFVTGMEKPPTIHDFGGFPRELFEVQYPAPGSPVVAELVEREVAKTSAPAPVVGIDEDEWGLDHGTWSVLRHVFPQAEIPVLQLSLDMTKGPAYHFEMGERLRALREQGVLIVGSGNLVHNLRRIEWDPAAKPYAWALEFDAWTKLMLEDGNFGALTKDYLATEAGRLAVPTPDHYFPALYILGAADAKDRLAFEWEEMQNGSISMRTFSFGLRG